MTKIKSIMEGNEIAQRDTNIEENTSIKQHYVMGNEAITRGAVEAGVRVVTGYPGTPASEILTSFVSYPDIYVEWSINETVALELVQGVSLCNQRAMAVMKHNGTNIVTDFLMHLNFTGVRGGMVLVSADDPGGNSSQNEEDTRILTHIYAHLPLFDPSSPSEAKAMTRVAFELSETTELCFVLRPVMRICHSRTLVDYEPVKELHRSADFVNDRSRYVMSAVIEKSEGGQLRPVVRHRWLNQKQSELNSIVEESQFNTIEAGEGKIGLVGCGIGYTYCKEAEDIVGRKFPILKIGTLPLPRKKVLAFADSVDKLIVFEEIEPVVERMLKEILYDSGKKIEILGRSGFLPAEGELSAKMVLQAIANFEDTMEDFIPQTLQSPINVPLRTRTQCIGCSHRSLLHALKLMVRKTKGVVTGDIGCYDAGSFPPLELISTIYCMGASIPMGSGITLSGLDKPVFAIIGDSTFFHSGISGLINAIYNKSKLVVIIADNRMTAMTGFQPNPGSNENIRGDEVHGISIEKFVSALQVPVFVVNPYNIDETFEALKQAVNHQGVSVVIASAPCFLFSKGRGENLFGSELVKVDPTKCNGCKVCIDYFGCPAMHFDGSIVNIDSLSCVSCMLCVDICRRGAIS
jgi:indolepyruvate ferredoxin oxidoreductase, alpha subunit